MCRGFYKRRHRTANRNNAGAVTKTFEKWNYCRALTQAEKEGTGANQKQLKEFIENWKSDSSVYSEDELNDMFERTY